MELLITILIALRALISPDQYNEAFKNEKQAEIVHAQNIIDSNKYSYDQWGGVIIDEDVSPK